MKAGWEETQIGQVCTVVAGQSPEGSAYNEEAIGLPFYQGKKEFGERLLGKPTTWTTVTTKEAKAGDILMSVRAPVGPINEATETICIGRGLAAIRAKAGLDKNFLWYVLLWLQPTIKGSSGAVFDSINKAGIESLPIPLPPLEEQQRIVAVLDEAFEGLTRARTHAEANLQNARELFRDVLRDTFRNGSEKWQTDLSPDHIGTSSRAQATRSRDSTQTGGRGATLRPISGPYSLAVLHPALPARRGWRWSQLTDLAQLESGHTPSRKHPEYWGGEIPWIGIKDARDHHGGEVSITLENTNPLGIANSSARVLPAQTVCLSRTASVGYVTIMGGEMATSQDFVNWICGAALLPEFLQFLFMAQGADIKRFASGSVHQTIYFPEVKAFHICHPPVTVQREICDAMLAVRNQAEALIGVYEAKLQSIDALRQSLLQKAFAGELT